VTSHELIETVWPREFLEKIDESLAYVAQRWPDLESSRERPIFIFAAGWRSGSTLLQRLVSSDATVGIFGEAFEHMFLWHQLAAQWKRFGPMDESHSVYLPKKYETLSAQAIRDVLTLRSCPTLTPAVQSLKNAHYEFIEALLKKPAAAVGRTRWGFKGVRCDGNVLRYLSWLYPNAGFLLLCRNPIDAWASYASIMRVQKSPSALCLPSHLIETASQFAAHWTRCAADFLLAADRSNTRFLRYEEMVRGEVLDQIDQLLELQIDRTILDVRLTASRNKQEVPPEERAAIESICGSTMEACGYPLTR
jgi:hypothetical protein